MALTEKIQLLGAGLYTDIPDELTLRSLPTISELDYVGSEDFDNTMIEKILPAAVEEKINFRNLLQIDYDWICRCLRIMNFGPYHSTNAIYCSKCGTIYGEYIVDLQNVECKALPQGFTREVVLSKDEFIDYKYDIKFELPTIGKVLTSKDDKFFTSGVDGEINRDLARICYMITEIGGQRGLTPMEIKSRIEDGMCAADYMYLKQRIEELENYGLRAGGTTKCPKCGSTNATFLALANDKFFRPSTRALQAWRDDRRKRKADDVCRDQKANV